MEIASDRLDADNELTNTHHAHYVIYVNAK